MKNSTPLLLCVFLLISAVSHSQDSAPDTSQLSEKALKFKKELSDFLSKKAVYPEQSIERKKWGDVILSYELDQAGNLSQPLILKSPDLLLTSSSIVTMNYLGKWNPEEIDFIPLGKEYHFVFRYRIYMNVMPVDNKARAVKLFNDAKYDKALKGFDKAISDNEYDHELYSFRARCKESLGDHEGAVLDHATAEKLRNEVMAVVDVITLGRATTTTVSVSGERIIAVPVR